MNKREMIQVIAEDTGESPVICEAVVEGFEQATQDALENKWRGRGNTEEEILEMTSVYAKVDRRICERVVPVMKKQIKRRISETLRFLRKR